MKSDFPLLARSPGLHYLDSAATSQKPKVVLDAVRDVYETAYANPHRGAYALSVAATDRYHAARERVARFLGIADAACLIFTRGTTESLNLVAATADVHRGDEIIVTRLEHHANFVPWQQLALRTGAVFKIAEITDDGRLDLDHLKSLITPRTKILAVTHVSNAIGSITPLADIVRMAHDVTIVVDGAQSAPHMKVEFDQLGVDFYAFSGHKMLGPTGIGGLVGRRELLEKMPPYQTGGDMIEFVGDDHTTWNVLPHKFEAGTPNLGGAVGLAAAAEYLDAIGMDRVRQHEQALTALASERLTAIEGVRVFGPPPSERSGVVSFTVADIHPHDLATILDQDGVAIRAGHHCAQPLIRRLGVGATARASFYVYNDERDVEALVAGVKRAQSLFANRAEGELAAQPSAAGAVHNGNV
jgi:cysteine desulfurase / selenocysteine lyase